MQRRVIAAVAAVLLAGIGAILLFSYVNTADKRAIANQAPTDVLVVTQAIPAGTPAEAIAPYVELRQLPKGAVVAGSLVNAADPAVAGLVTSTELQVGEQLLQSRFIQPGITDNGEVAVPDDLQTLTLQLDPQRTVGSAIAPGDKLAVFVSMEVDDEPQTTLMARDVLVTRVQGAPDQSTVDEKAAPSGELILTVALAPKDAGRLIWAAEYAKGIWLALEPKAGEHETTPTITVKHVL